MSAFACSLFFAILHLDYGSIESFKLQDILKLSWIMYITSALE